jgi:hypothetical protein
MNILVDVAIRRDLAEHAIKQCGGRIENVPWKELANVLGKCDKEQADLRKNHGKRKYNLKHALCTFGACDYYNLVDETIYKSVLNRFGKREKKQPCIHILEITGNGKCRYVEKKATVESERQDSFEIPTSPRSVESQ